MAAGEAVPAGNTAAVDSDGVARSGLEDPIRTTMSKAAAPAAPGLVAVFRAQLIRSASCHRSAVGCPDRPQDPTERPGSNEVAEAEGIEPTKHG